MSAATQIQKIASQTQLQLQQMVNSSNELQSRYNAEEAQKSRDWQTEMSKTAHQMEVADLKKAGLNPVLSSGGSGAQSYTTSSASMTPESGAAALANLQGSQLGAIGNIESSRMAAAATRKAAAVSAAAMRSAAAQSAAAQIYAADKGYKKAVKVAKIGADVQKATNEANKWIAINKQAQNPFAIFDKYLSKSGFGDKALQGGSSFVNRFQKNVSSYFKGNGEIKYNNFALTKQGKSQVDSFLRKNNMAVNKTNRKLAVQAFVFKNSDSVRKFYNSYTVYNRAKPKNKTFW